MATDDFASLTQPHLMSMMRVAAALVGQADAEDAAQEAIVRAWQNLPNLRDPGALRSWLLRITVNVCADWQRGRFGTTRRATTPLLDDDDAAPLALLGADPGASDNAAALDLRQAITTLDTPLRFVVVLHYYAGLTTQEIADSLNVPAPTIRTRLRRALTLLRLSLNDHDPLPTTPDPERNR